MIFTTDEQKARINQLLIERYFTQRNANVLGTRLACLSGSKNEWFIRLDRLDRLSDEVADKLIAAIEKAPTKQEAEEREARNVTMRMKKEALVEWAKDHGLLVHKKMKEEDVVQVIFDAGLVPPKLDMV